MSELNVNVKDFLDTVNVTLSKELKFIKDNDWTKVTSREARTEQHDLQVLITDRAVKNAVKLYDLCKQDTSPKPIKSAINKFLDMYEIYNSRYEYYTKEEDWTTYTDRISEMSEEIKFQSDIMKKLSDFKAALRKINFGGEGNNFEIVFRDNTPAPFMMENKIEELHPEIEKLKDGTETETKRSGE